MFLSGNDCDRSGIICGAQESCVNKTDGYECNCNTGYIRNGTQCQGETKMFLQLLTVLPM